MHPVKVLRSPASKSIPVEYVLMPRSGFPSLRSPCTPGQAMQLTATYERSCISASCRVKQLSSHCSSHLPAPPSPKWLLTAYTWKRTMLWLLLLTTYTSLSQILRAGWMIFACMFFIHSETIGNARAYLERFQPLWLLACLKISV